MPCPLVDLRSGGAGGGEFIMTAGWLNFCAAHGVIVRTYVRCPFFLFVVECSPFDRLSVYTCVINDLD